jgi:parallel beta-helix repeat protein
MVNSKPLFYFKNSSDINLSDIPVGELILANCNSFNLGNLTINDTDVGIEIAYSSNINIDIIRNNISNNFIGFYLYDSSEIKIYHNNILNNTYQAYDILNGNKWDNSYPSGGNYWSDYSGVDNLKGSDQDIPGSDGIGDTNFTIDSDSLDNYPLMGPYPSSGIILHPGWNLISVPAIQSNITLASVLESIRGEYNAVQWYNSTDTQDHWKHYQIKKPSYLNDLKVLNHDFGFLVYITNPNGTFFRYDGVNPIQNQNIILQKGWNMVGYPSLTKYNRTEGLNNLTFGNHVDAIWSWDAEAQRWEEMGESDHFMMSGGYYIHAKTKCEWEVPL